MNAPVYAGEQDPIADASKIYTRAQAAATIYRQAGSPTGPFPAAGFIDVALDNVHATAIDWLVATGVTVGRKDGTFGPDAAMTRSAKAAMLYRLAGSPQGPFPPAGFRDVPMTATFYAEINWLAATAITSGFDDGRFKGGRMVTPRQVTAFMTRFERHATINVPAVAIQTPETGAPVKAVPSAPQNVMVSGSSTRLDLVWDVPQNDGGADVTGYAVAVVPDVGVVVVDGRTAAITGLTNGTAYTVTVVATNGVGDSGGVSITGTPAAVPLVPQNVTVISPLEQLELAWDVPLDDGGADITGYTVTVHPNEGVVAVDGRTATITGLTNGTAYTVIVVATNGGGDSVGASATGTPGFYLATNGVTIVCSTVPVGATAKIGATTYTKRERGVTGNVGNDVSHIRAAASTTCTSGITDMSQMFQTQSVNGQIGHWDTSHVTTMDRMFTGSGAFNQDIGSWDTSQVNNMNGMFQQATSFDQNINSWGTGKVMFMSSMFNGATNFNQDISQWDTSAVTTMAGMFRSTGSFNQPINDWVTLNVSNMADMFRHTRAFNQSLDQWDTSKVTSMSFMFHDATMFNQSIGGWNTGSVTLMNDMFKEAPAFNQPIGDWDTSNVTTMQNMFQAATSFNQPIGGWNTSKVANLLRVFTAATSFNQNLSGWNVCVFSSAPFQFDSGARAWTLQAHRPIWGSNGGDPCE